jgi:hypothetical protein
MTGPRGFPSWEELRRSHVLMLYARTMPRAQAAFTVAVVSLICATASAQSSSTPPPAGSANGPAGAGLPGRTAAEVLGDTARERARQGDCAGALKLFDQALQSSTDLTLDRRIVVRLYRDRGMCHEKLAQPYPAIEDYRLAEERGWLLTRQFDNEANPAYHRQTTGAEILADFATRRLDYWVTGWGTGGTLTGAGQVIKCARPETKIVACEPAGAALLEGKEWKPHKIQGWTPDFVPSVLDRDVFDDVIAIADERAIACARDLARSEGIFCGISGGGTFAAALEVAAKAEKGSVVLAMLPDTGERYLSTPLFEGVETGSDVI